MAFTHVNMTMAGVYNATDHADSQAAHQTYINWIADYTLVPKYFNTAPVQGGILCEFEFRKLNVAKEDVFTVLNMLNSLESAKLNWIMVQEEPVR